MTISERSFRLAAALALSAAAAWTQTGTAVLSSPDGKLSITFQTVTPPQDATETVIDPVMPVAPAGGQLVYAVSFQGKPLIDQSPLGLDLQGQVLLGPNVRIVNAARSQTDETYKLIAGKASSVRNHFNAVRVDLEETGTPGRKLAMEARAYDDAVAFRYVVPDQTPIRAFRLVKEKTEFRISKDATTYPLCLPNFQSAYESEFIRIAASGLAHQGGVPTPKQLVGLPLTMEVPGVAWLSITEADLRDYAGMYLVNPSEIWGAHRFEARLAPNINEPDISVSGSLPHHSAWRVLLVGTEPGRLIESNAIASLNPPSAIQDTSWIHPGRASWPAWNGSIGPDGKRARSTENLKYYADFAAKSGFEYLLVDGGWSPRDNILKMSGWVDIPELVRYAGAKGVKVWIWAHWSAVDRQMEEAFPLFEKWGVAGVKVDYMMRDDQAMIGFYYRVAEKAAQHHLMIDYHGASKPWGIERTWPNVLGYEGILGMEQSWATGRDTPDQHVMFPFTRMVAGMMDYTPGSFHNMTKAEYEPRNVGGVPATMGTRAHQLAMYAVYEAPFQMVSDTPAAYEDQPAFDFIKNIPPTWDETRAVNGEPGEYVTIVRRRGSEWFLGSMTSWMPRELDIPLTFLGSGQYTAVVYADSADADRFPKNVSVQRQPVDRGTHLKAHLAPGGGYAVRLIPVKQ
jgi:alpha-glucosidase